MEKENIYAKIKENSLMEFLIGLMEENIKVNMSIIKKKDLELIIGLTEEYMKECGKTDIKIGELFGHNLKQKRKGI